MNILFEFIHYYFFEKKIEAAITQALIHYSNPDSMITHDLSTEVIYCLSPNRSVKQALSMFGVQPDSKELIVLLFHPVNNLSTEDLNCHLDRIIKSMDGDRIDQNKIQTNLSDSNLVNSKRERVSNFYGIGKAESNLISCSLDPHKTFLESVLSRMAARDLFRS